uniref:Helicase ATP-binding domain-containing protein n=1 Tax=viral metagenome TaxID=1070528 RepID=A0A6C0DZL3_9ZZZZ
MACAKKGSYLSKFGYVLCKDSLQPDEIYDLKNDLVGRPIGGEFGGIKAKPDTYILYTETKNKLYIPKMYGLKKYGNPKEHQMYLGSRFANTISFKGELLPLQIEASQKMLLSLSQKGGAILSLGTGLGKTTTCLHILSKLNKKTIVIVNKITLMKQWEEEIKKFLPEASIGFIQGQKNVDTHGKDIIIAMLQSLAKIDYPKELFEDIGCTVVDEIHNTSSKVFSKVLMKMCSQYTIGLTATPQRSDGCDYVFKWFIGDVVFTSKAKREGLIPIVYTIKLESVEYKEITIENKFTSKQQIQFTSMVTSLINMKKRNELIIEKLRNLVKEKRRILVLSDRREHLYILKGLLDEARESFSYGLFLGAMKMKDLQKSKCCQVILATYAAFGEGVSEKDLDTLFLVSPKKYVGHLQNSSKNESGKLEQIVGRIFRKDHIDIQPMIIDIQDNFSVYRNQSKQRMTFYKEHFTRLMYRSEHINLDTGENCKPMRSDEERKEIKYDVCLLD